MSFESHYKSPERTLWQGRHDSPNSSCFFQLVKMLDISKHIPLADHRPAFALLGFCCDEGIRRNLGRTGAAEGPDSFRSVFAKLPSHRPDLQLFDAGNVICNTHDLEAAQSVLAEAVHSLLDRGYTPIVIGGGHEMAWGHYQGIAKKLTKENLGIINMDTHFDMRPTLEENKGTSGTPFLQIAKAHETAKRRFDYHCIGIQPYGNTRALFAAAEHYQVNVLSADDIHMKTDALPVFVQRAINDNQFLYLSLCLDVFSAAYAPGVSAPQAFGLSPWDLLPAVRQIAKSGKVISYDVAELSPKYDVDSRTAKLAANFVYEIIHHHQNN
jgi:formiminoglutamase